MIVLIMANQSGHPLAPLLDKRSMVQLKVAGKSLLEHCIEAVAQMAPERVVVAGSRELLSLREFVSDGTRWGAAMETVPAKLDEPATSVIARIAPAPEEPVFVVPADRLFGAPLAEHVARLQRCEQTGNGIVDAATQLHLFPGARQPMPGPATPGPVTLSDIEVHHVSCLHSFHAINLLAARGDIPSIRLRGSERALGLRTGFMTRLHPRTIRSGSVFAGNRCRVHRSCRFDGQVVLHDGVVVDRLTEVQNSVILDNTYLGEHLRVRNAIVAGNRLIRVDTGAVLELTDRFLAADMSRGFYEAHLADSLGQVAGAVLLLASLPLWPVAAVVALLEAPRKPMSSRRFISNRRMADDHTTTFQALQFETGLPLLRRLPLLIPVVAGHLRLVGISPYGCEDLPEEAQSWQVVGEQQLAGLLGPTQLHLGLDASPDQRMLSDTVFAQEPRSFRNDMRILRSALRRLLAPRHFNERELWKGV